MNKLVILIACLLAQLILSAQSINLKQGEEYVFQTSLYTNSDSKNYDDASWNRTEEQLDIKQITLKVIEANNDNYKLEAFFEDLHDSRREKKDNDLQWRSGNYFDKSLINANSKFINLEFKVEFLLSKQSEISEIKVVDAISELSKNYGSETLSPMVNAFLSKLFIVVPDSIIVGKEIDYNTKKYTVEKLFENKTLISCQVKEGNSSLINKLLVDLNSGLILEGQYYSESENLETTSTVTRNGNKTIYKGLQDSKSQQLIKLIKTNETPFTCKHDKNGTFKDTTFAKTNVTVRGKVRHPAKNRKVAIMWSGAIPGGYNRQQYVTTLNDDNSFELRFWLDEMMQCTFRQKEVSEIYLMPGDDVYIEVDIKEFDESITATGIGSGNLNYCFKTFLFKEENKIRTRKLYDDARDKYLTCSADEFKAHYLLVLDKLQGNTTSNLANITPEVFLAEYWENQTTIFDILKDFPRRQEYYRKKENEEPLAIDKTTYYDFDYLIHADNDMMNFCPSYDHFIRGHAFFYLDDKLYSVTGKGNVTASKNFYDELYKQRYSMCNTLFSGLTGQTLKYTVICDAMQRASWDTYECCYNNFLDDYPNSPKCKILTEAYNKAKKTAAGQPAYNFTLSDFDGKQVSLSDFKGKVVYIDFWATSCGPCRVNIERYSNQLHEKFEGKDIVFVYVALEHQLDRPKAYMEKHGIKGVQLIAKGKQEALIREKYMFNGIPRYYIIDKDGIIVDKEAPRSGAILNKLSILQDVIDKK